MPRLRRYTSEYQLKSIVSAWASYRSRLFCSNVVSLAQNFRYNGSSPTNHFLCRKTRINIFSYGIGQSLFCRLLSQCTRLTDRRTDGRTERLSQYRACCITMQSHGKNRFSQSCRGSQTARFLWLTHGVGVQHSSITSPGGLLCGLVYRVVIKQVRQSHLRVADTSTESHVSRDINASRLAWTTTHVAAHYRPVTVAPVWKPSEHHAWMIFQRHLQKYSHLL